MADQPFMGVMAVAGAQTEALAQSLSGVAAFSRLPASSLAELAGMASRREYSSGQMVVREGDLWPYALYLASGWLRWSLADSRGRRQMLVDVPAGEMVWGHTLFDDQPMPADLEVRQAAVTFRWEGTAIRAIVGSHPESMWEVCRSLVRSTRRSRALVGSFAFHTVPQRVAALLLRWYPETDGTWFRRSLTLEEMAAYVGSTPALVCKSIYAFADQGILNVTRTHFEFLNRCALQDYASEGSLASCIPGGLLATPTGGWTEG